MENRYYWIKLKTDFFNEEKIDFLMSQKNGSDYVVLYQMLCLKSANNNGILATSINEIMIPFDIEKITRDTKYFNKDTVIVAMELYKKLGLIFQEENKGLLCIKDFETLVGSECSSAKRVREFREKQNLLQCNTDVTQEYRDKSIEYRDKSIDTNTKKESKEKSEQVAHTFKKPTVEEIEIYCKERSNGINAQRFFDFYESKGWLVGKSKMKNWQACVRTWEQRDVQQATSNKQDFTEEELKFYKGE